MLISRKNFKKEHETAVKNTAENLFCLQKTLRNPISCVGLGLHSGNRIYMTLKPANPNTGIVFRRVDIYGNNTIIPANVSNVVDTRLCSCLGSENGVKISTVEHLMAAFHALEIDNAEVEINGSEIPAMDGSSSPFVFLIECAGIEEQPVVRKAIKILKEISVVENGIKASLKPTDANNLVINFEINFSAKAVGNQAKTFEVSSKGFKNEIAGARTFGFMEEVEKLRSAGFARGGSLENAVVIDGDTIMNEEGLRYYDEFVRHKILDSIGDLYLAGHAIIGEFTASCSGHAHTALLLKKMFEDPSSYKIIDAKTNQEITNSQEKVLATA